MSLSSRVYAEDGADITNQISRIDVGLYQKFSPHRAKDGIYKKTRNMKSRQQNYRMQNAKIQTRQDIYGMKKTKYRKLTTYQQKCRKRPGVEATHGRSITNSRKPNWRI